MSVPQATGTGTAREENPMEALVSAREQLRQAHEIVDSLNDRLFGRTAEDPPMSPLGPQNLGALSSEVRTNAAALTSRMQDIHERIGSPMPEPARG